mgnify:CR=1 FL=1
MVGWKTLGFNAAITRSHAGAWERDTQTAKPPATTCQQLQGELDEMDESGTINCQIQLL